MKLTEIVSLKADITYIDSESTRAIGVEGDLSTLSTTDQSSLVNAVNEVDSNLDSEVTNRTTADNTLQTNIDSESTRAIGVEGDLSTLSTTDQSSLVNAVNEVDSNLDSHTSNISIHFTQNKSDFDPAADDTTVVITGVVLVVADIDVFIDGTLQRDTTYTVSDDGTDTTITFNTAFAGGEWVRVNYFI